MQSSVKQYLWDLFPKFPKGFMSEDYKLTIKES